MRRYPWVWVLSALVAALPAHADATDDRIEELEQKIKVLERKQELKDEEAASRDKEAAKVAVGRDGFTFKSADGAYQLKIRGYVHVDGRFVANEPGRPVSDTFVVRRARPVFDATLAGRFDFKL